MSDAGVVFQTADATIPKMVQTITNSLRDDPYITSYILEGCLTPTPPIVINRHILAYPNPSITIILSYFDIPPFTFHINIKSAFIFNPVEITSILFSLINHLYLHVRNNLRSNCKKKIGPTVAMMVIEGGAYAKI